MNKRRHPRVRVEPAVTEDWIREVVEYGASPTEFAEWVLATVDLRSSLERFVESPGLGEGEIRVMDSPVGEENKPPTMAAADISGVRQNKEDQGWSRASFHRFLDVASRIPDLEWSLALLHAYAHVGPMPTSEQLQAICGFEEDIAWQQELRIAKQRLTLQARKSDAPPVFPRAKSTSDGARLHPIEPVLFPWLQDWIESRKSGSSDDEVGLPDPELWGPTIEDSGKYRKDE